jgi:hypothetical protein
MALLADLRLVGTRMLALYQRTDKFILTALLLVPMIVYMAHIQATINHMGAQYQATTSPGFISKVVHDTAMSLLFPVAKHQQCDPCPKVCNNETHNLYLPGDVSAPPNKTFVEYKWVVTVHTHEVLPMDAT